MVLVKSQPSWLFWDPCNDMAHCLDHRAGIHWRCLNAITSSSCCLAKAGLVWDLTQLLSLHTNFSEGE